MPTSLVKKEPSNLKYYLMLISVVIIWGVVPTIKRKILTDIPAEIMTAITAIIAFTAMLLICSKSLKLLNKAHFKIAIFSGIFYSVANILANVGLSISGDTTMAAFLDNLSCLIVPFLVWFMTKKRPAIFKFIGAVLCLISLFFLSFRNGLNAFKFGTGDLLCALSGLCYGVNIAVTGIKAKKLDPRLYLLIQFGVFAIVSTVYAIVITVYNSMSHIDAPAITFEMESLLLLIAYVLVSYILGWLIRTICLTHLPPSFVAVVMPFSSIITALVAVISGDDVLSLGLILGAIIGLTAAITSNLDINRLKRKYKYMQYKKAKEQRLAEATAVSTATPPEQTTPELPTEK